MHKRRQDIATIVCFLAAVFGMAVLSLVYPVREFSERENTSLAQMPEIEAKAYFSGEFAQDYEKFLTDQFPFRDNWIGVKTAIERGMFKQETKDVYFAGQRYLIEAHTGVFTKETAAANIEYLRVFMESCAKKYGQEHVTAMVVPNAVDILRELLPPYASPYDEETYLEKVSSAMPQGVWFDSSRVLQEHKDVQLYYRTDHHWTTQAAYYVYAAWAKEQGLSPLGLDAYRAEVATEEFKGTIDAKVGGENASDAITIYRPREQAAYEIRHGADGSVTHDLYEYSFLDTRDKYGVFFGSNQGLLEASIQNGSDRRLLVVKDSYAHCFLPFTFHDFAEVDLVDLRYYNESLREYMEQGDYTDVLFLYNAAGFAEDESLIKLGL